MYEFTDKEIRSKFKRTKYGKKTNKMLYTSLVITLILALPYALITILNINIDENLISSLSYLLIVALCVVCYFDGKRDGAIEQFKKNNKN